MREGFLHIYTGNGKGKTTAAIGLAVRALGAGRKVLFAQFLKSAHYSEHRVLKTLSNKITVSCFGTGKFIKGNVRPADIRAAEEGLEEIAMMLSQNRFDLVILDEVIVALNMGLLQSDRLLDIIHERPLNIEMVLTGRGAPQILIDAADLVTEMMEIKHYYQLGIAARKGIEM